jgi:hypothetical protein
LKDETQSIADPEIAAINAVVAAIRDLDQSAQKGVIDYVIRRFGLRIAHADEGCAPFTPDDDPSESSRVTREEPAAGTSDGLAGISPVARKWMSRNSLTADGLSKLFSLGIDEIDLVAKKIPGKSKKERMRSVILLKSVAAYLGSGVARVSHEQVTGTCLHYGAFDATHFARDLKKLAAEIGGTKESGYTLTARGLTNATELVEDLLNAPTK